MKIIWEQCGLRGKGFSQRVPLVGACLATGDRIFAIVSQNRFAILWLFLLDFKAYNHGLKGPQKPKTYCDNSRLRSYLSPPVFTVRSGPV